MGNKLGDSTAKDLGKNQLESTATYRPYRTIFAPLTDFYLQHILSDGPNYTVYPENFKDVKKDEVFIAIAGPISNLVWLLLYYS